MLFSFARISKCLSLVLTLSTARAGADRLYPLAAVDGDGGKSMDTRHDLAMAAQGTTKDSLGTEVALESDLVDGDRFLGDVTSNIGTGKWYTFYHYSRGGTGGFVQGCSPTTVRDCPGAPGVTLPTDVNTPPWIITSPTCTLVRWTETWYQDNQFELWVDGVRVATGSPPRNGINCGENPNTCYDGGLASKGSYLLPPGRQSIHFKIVDPSFTDRGAFRVDSYPCPAGNVNSYVDSGTWFDFETNYLGDATIGEGIPSPWTFYHRCPVEFSIVEVFISNNQFRIYDNGVLVGTTNLAARDRCDNGYIEPDGGCGCVSNIEECIAFGAANGKFRLPAGFHSITIKGFPSLVDYGVFKIDTRCPTPAPTKSPTSSPTPSPTATANPTVGPPSAPPTKSPVGGVPPSAGGGTVTDPPTNEPTNLPTKPPTHPPTNQPTRPPTPAPTPCPARETTATFELWDGDTNARVSAITNTTTSCLRGNWNIRAVTTHEQAACGAVRIRFYDPLRPNAVVKRRLETAPPYFLYGDNAATGDVYGNTNVRPRIRGLTLANNHRYCIRSETVQARGFSEQCFTNLCT